MKKNGDLVSEVTDYILKTDLPQLCGIRVGDIAREFKVSRFHLSRVFKKGKKVNPANFLRRIKLLKCAMLVAGSGSLRIKKMSQNSGFSDPAYFSRIFKKQFSRGPRRYV